jgi:hypothetical protein
MKYIHSFNFAFHLNGATNVYSCFKAIQGSSIIPMTANLT